MSGEEREGVQINPLEGEVRECDKCGKEYTEYAVFIERDWMGQALWEHRKEEYQHLCEECNAEWYDENAP